MPARRGHNPNTYAQMHGCTWASGSDGMSGATPVSSSAKVSESFTLFRLLPERRFEVPANISAKAKRAPLLEIPLCPNMSATDNSARNESRQRKHVHPQFSLDVEASSTACFSSSFVGFPNLEVLHPQ